MSPWHKLIKALSKQRHQTSPLVSLQELQKSSKLSFHALWNKIMTALFSAPLKQFLIFIAFNLPEYNW